MKKIEDIEHDVEQLPLDDFVKLAARVDQRRRQVEIFPSTTSDSKVVGRDHSAFLNSYSPKTRGYTMTPQPGDVWLADIPFTSGVASKLRRDSVFWTDAVDRGSRRNGGAR